MDHKFNPFYFLENYPIRSILAVTFTILLATLYHCSQDEPKHAPKPVMQQEEPEKERRIIKIAKWLWTKD